MPEVELSVSWKGRLTSASLRVDIDKSTACRDLVGQLVDEGWGRKGACHLVERWHRCERLLPGGELVPEAVGKWNGRVCLKCEEGRSVKRGERKRGRGRRTRYLRCKMTQKKLCYLRYHLKMVSISLSTQMSTIWLEKLAQGAGTSVKHPLQPFKDRLAELKRSNLQLSTEISELNIQAGDLAGELHTLRTEGCDLSDGVRCVEEDVRARKWEKERDLRSRVAELQTEAIRLRRELETRNKLNCAQSSKLETLKKTLAERRREASQYKEELVRVKAETRAATQSHDSDTPPPPSYDAMLNRMGYNTPQSEKRTHTPSSARKKKAVFEARTREQLEAEAEEFRRQRQGERKGTGNSSAKQLDFSSEHELSHPPDLIKEAEKLLTVPQADSQWYASGEGSNDISYRENIDQVLAKSHLQGAGQEVWSVGDMGGSFFSEVMSSVEQCQSVSKACVNEKQPTIKQVHFSPEALILPAALDGDLDTVRDCVHQLGSCDQRSHKGATCLHNAVCSGHHPTLQYLVERGCDVNAQDEDGWTPLHCAVAYSNSAAISTLLNHGACLWLVTEEGDTALALASKELAAQGELGTADTQTAAQQSHLCLQKAHRDVGVANGGVVYALFSHNTADSVELNFNEGEQLLVLCRGKGGAEMEGWWEVENGSGDKGLAPSTYLGSTPRYQVTV